MLSAEALATLKTKHGELGQVDFRGHTITLRRPSRLEAREYRRKEDSPREKPDRVDQLLQSVIVAFDGTVEPVACRELLNAFLETAPNFCDSPKVGDVLGVLLGQFEEEDSRILGKDARILR